MRRSLLVATMTAALAAACAGSACAADYLTAGGDNARTGWIKDEKILTKASVGKVHLLWSKKLDGATPREYHNLFSPLIASAVRTATGVKEVAVVAGVSDMLWGMDAKTGDVLWSKHFDYTANGGVVPATGGRLCPGGQTAMPTVEKLADGSYKIWALSGDGRLWQVDAATGANIAPPVKYAPDNGKVFALNLYNGYIYTALSQGCGGNDNQVIAFNTRNQRTSVLYPAGGGMWGRRGVAIDDNGNAWMGTGDGGFRPDTGQLGNVVVGVKPDATGLLQLTGYFAPISANWMWKRDLDINVSPMVIDYQGKHFMAVSNKSCRLWLADLDKLGVSATNPVSSAADMAAHRQDVDTSSLICNDRQLWDEKGVWGTLSSYQSSKGDEWIYVPFWGEKSIEFNPPIINTPAIPGPTVANNQASVNGGVAAFTVSQVGGKWKLVPKWLSQNMDMAEEGLVANDIFWVFASGVNARQQGREIAWNDTTTAFGSPHDMSSHVTVYALDAQTGKTLWSSGNTVTSYSHFSSITVANGKVYVGTFDGAMWCFGVNA